MIALFFVILSAFNSAPAIAGESSCKALQTSNLPFWEQVSERTATSPADRYNALYNACEELNPAGKFKGSLVKPPLGPVFSEIEQSINVVVTGLAGLAKGSFTNMNGNDFERTYKAKLELIKGIPDPIERIKRVYELSTSVQGRYGDGSSVSVDPETVLSRAQKTGSGGVCRDFAALLYWSLLQVARYRHSSSMALGPTDFSPEYETGDVLIGNWFAGHAWIRVNLPQRHVKGPIQFRQFDLDPTFYPEVFTPLPPRQAGMTTAEQKSEYASCTATVDCLTRSWTKATGFGGMIGGIVTPPWAKTTSQIKTLPSSSSPGAGGLGGINADQPQ